MQARRNFYGCYDDRDQELIDDAKREAHELGVCEGAPVCGYCLDIDRGEETEEE